MREYNEVDNEMRHDGALSVQPSVLIPQHPTRMTGGEVVRMPLDLSDARRYGPLLELLEPGAKPFDQDSIEELDQNIASSCAEDYILCVGNPTLIGVACASFALLHGRLNVLQWQSKKGVYEAIQIEFTDEGAELCVATVPPALGEDDEH